MTEAGVILGTAAYMSPEQAAGKTVDKRSDLWAFGVVLLEMLTGQRVFQGETVSHVLASVLKDEPDWTKLPVATPTAIRRLLRRCLEKDRKRRLESASDARLELVEPDDHVAAEPRSAAPRRPFSTWILRAALAAVVVVGAWVAGGAGRPRTVPASSGPVVRSLVDVAPAEWLQATPFDRADNGGRPYRTPMAISPDGQYLVFSGAAGGRQQLYIRFLSDVEAKPIAGTEGAGAPFVSPDGEWIGFYLSRNPMQGALWKGFQSRRCASGEGVRDVPGLRCYMGFRRLNRVRTDPRRTAAGVGRGRYSTTSDPARCYEE